jgi:hypothetical protein
MSHTVSGLRNNLAETALTAHSEVYFRLKEAELEAKTTSKRFTHAEVFSTLRHKAQVKATDDV